VYSKYLHKAIPQERFSCLMAIVTYLVEHPDIFSVTSDLARLSEIPADFSVVTVAVLQVVHGKALSPE
jgi:hypothetical protein